MKKEQNSYYEAKAFVLVPQEVLANLIDGQERILKALTNQSKETETIGDYIPESQAKRLLGRKTTWFWNLRKSGKLTFSKVGNKIFYSKANILKFMEGERNEK